MEKMMEKILHQLTVLLIFLTILSACNSTNSGANSNATLDGITWTLVSLNGQSVLEGSEVTAVFNQGESQMNGIAGCNNYFADYTADAGTLSIGTSGATRMICADPDGVMQQEAAFLAALPTITAYQIQGDILEMNNTAGESVLTFTVKGGS